MGLTEVAPGSSGALSPSRRAEKDLGVGWTEGLGFIVRDLVSRVISKVTILISTYNLN